MCGIIITKIKGKLQDIKHRGVEFGFVEEHGFYLGHHRLPIQTQSGDSWRQPIELNTGGYLLYNGEIFNYPKQYENDVAYLKDLFENNGPYEDSMDGVLNAANNWDGFWAIVYVCEATGCMYAFTDPLGKKQLYYNTQGEICSEIHPLVDQDHIVFDRQFKSSVYKWGYNRDDRTPYEGISRIIPNRLYTFYYGDCSGELLSVSPKDYFDWDLKGKIEQYTGLIDLLVHSVQTRLIHKSYDIGALISGGLDSSIIALILQELKAKVNYYTVENGETEYVGILASHLGIKYKKLEYSLEHELRAALVWGETPIDLGSLVPQHKLMSVIPEKIVMTGDGADELFGGYKRINTYDSQMSDIFEELTYYHLPRLDRASMRYTIELRNPFLSHDIIKYAMKLPYRERTNKKILKDTFGHLLPPEIVNREKLALKNNQLREDPEQYKRKVFQLFYGTSEIF